MELLTAIWTVYTYLCVVFATFFLVGLVRNLYNVFNKKDTNELVERIKRRLKVVYTEQVGSAYYLYEKTTNNFIAQGPTEDEMWANARLICPSQEFIIEGENGVAVLVSVKDKQ
jgi:hypothetical protein